MKTGFVSIVLLCALPAVAAPKDKDKKSTAAASEKSSGVAPNLVVVRDQETGALRPPTAEEHERLTRQLRQTLSPKSYPVVENPDGSKIVRLDGYLRFSVVRKGADGKSEQRCFADPAAAATFLSGPSAPPSKEK